MLRLSILDPSAPVYYLIISGRHSGEDAMVFGAASFLSVKSSIRAARNLGAMLAALVTLHGCAIAQEAASRSEEHTSELQSLMRISYAVFCLKKKKTINNDINTRDD